MKNICIKKALHNYCVVLFSMRKISYFEKVYKSFMKLEKDYSQFYHNILTNLREKIKRAITHTSNNSSLLGVCFVMRITEKTIDRRIYINSLIIL